MQLLHALVARSLIVQIVDLLEDASPDADSPFEGKLKDALPFMGKRSQNELFRSLMEEEEFKNMHGVRCCELRSLGDVLLFYAAASKVSAMYTCIDTMSDLQHRLRCECEVRSVLTAILQCRPLEMSWLSSLMWARLPVSYRLCTHIWRFWRDHQLQAAAQLK